MYIPYFSITPLISKNLEGIGEVFGFLKNVTLPPHYQLEYALRVAAETVHASTAIEGNTLTQEQVTDVSKQKKVNAIDKDKREVENYFQTLVTVNEMVDSLETFSEAIILRLHNQLLSGVNDQIAGTYRTIEVRVGDYIPPQAWQVPRLMNDFVEWLNKPLPQDLSSVLYAGIAHYQLVAIHPFVDGNGRTSRALVTLYLMMNGYDITQSFSLESYYNRERSAYYQALSGVDRSRSVAGKPDLTQWLEYFTTGFLVEGKRAQNGIQEYLRRSRHQESIVLTTNQKKLLAITAAKGAAAMTDYLQKLPIKQKGAYNAAQKLIDLGLLKSVGERKGRHYIVTEKGLNFISQ